MAPRGAGAGVVTATRLKRPRSTGSRFEDGFSRTIGSMRTERPCALPTQCGSTATSVQIELRKVSCGVCFPELRRSRLRSRSVSLNASSTSPRTRATSCWTASRAPGRRGRGPEDGAQVDRRRVLARHRLHVRAAAAREGGRGRRRGRESRRTPAGRAAAGSAFSGRAVDVRRVWRALWLAEWAADGSLGEATAAQVGFGYAPKPPFAGRKGRTRLAVNRRAHQPGHRAAARRCARPRGEARPLRHGDRP